MGYSHLMLKKLRFAPAVWTTMSWLEVDFVMLISWLVMQCHRILHFVWIESELGVVSMAELVEEYTMNKNIERGSHVGLSWFSYRLPIQVELEFVDVGFCGGRKTAGVPGEKPLK